LISHVRNGARELKKNGGIKAGETKQETRLVIKLEMNKNGAGVLSKRWS